MVIIEFLLWSIAIMAVALVGGAVAVAVKEEWNKIDEEQEVKHGKDTTQ